MKRLGFIALVGGLLGSLLVQVTPAMASALVTFSGSISAADLNSNLNHIHNTMVGGHGARLVDADVSATAAVAHSKLATPALVPKIWATVGSATCAASPCTVAASGGTYTNVTRSAAGTYSLNFDARTDANFGVLVTSRTTDVYCYAGALTTTAAPFVCVDAAGTEADAAFTILLLDNT